MKKITIHTWRCVCGYAQDFDPMDEAMVKKIFHDDKMRDFSRLSVGSCPACHLNGQVQELPKCTDSAQMSEMNIMEESDLPQMRQELENAPPHKVSTGVGEIRQETEEERSKRISAALESHPEQLRASIQVELEKTPLINREFPVFRDETPDEKAYRIDTTMTSRIPPTAEQIEALCAQYEYK